MKQGFYVPARKFFVATRTQIAKLGRLPLMMTLLKLLWSLEMCIVVFALVL